jgi:hypothetical protein
MTATVLRLVPTTTSSATPAAAVHPLVAACTVLEGGS